MGIVLQAIKFGVIGVGNTLLTLTIIWFMTKQMRCSETLSNFIGYLIGLINSFFLNRKWTFHSHGKVWNSAVKFFAAFAICYILQLIILLLLNRYCPNNPPLYAQLKIIWQDVKTVPMFSPIETIWRVLKFDPQFYIQILSTIVYTAANFIINKYYTFK